MNNIDLDLLSELGAGAAMFQEVADSTVVIVKRHADKDTGERD